MEDKNALKIQALRQSISELVVNYEDKIAEYRADATIQMDSLHTEINSLREQLEAERNKNATVEEAADSNEG